MVKLDLPEPETPVTQVKVPSGMAAVTFLRLLAVAPVRVSFLPVPLRRVGRERDGAAAGEIIGGQAVLVGEHLVERAAGDHLAAMDAGARAHVDDIIGVADRVLVMLDDDDGVAEIAQAAEGDEQPVIVALVEADAGLVEHVEHAGEAGADLAGEADALALAAGERARGAVEVEIVEADIVEEAEPLVDLLEDGAGDLVLLRGELLVRGVENQASAWRTERRWTWLICSPAIFTASGSGRRRAPWQISQGAAL